MPACLCEALRPEASRVIVGVLQHPREARVPKSTGSLVPLALSNAFVLRGIDLDRNGELEARLAPFPAGSVGLLFPEGAAAITDAPDDITCLLVPDGSWSQARSILHSTASLRQVPRFALPAGARGSFPIRRPQGEGRISTLEATVQALRILEHAPEAYRAAIGLQQALVDRQLDHMRTHGAQHPALGTGSWRGRRGGKEKV